MDSSTNSLLGGGISASGDLAGAALGAHHLGAGGAGGGGGSSSGASRYRDPSDPNRARSLDYEEATTKPFGRPGYSRGRVVLS